MKLGKKLTATLLTACMAAGTLAACGNSEPAQTDAVTSGEDTQTKEAAGTESGNADIDWEEDPSEVNWFMWAVGASAPSQESLDRIEEKINEITLKEINVQVNLTIMEMGSYLTQMPMQITAGDKIDLITTFPAGSGSFNTMAASGQLLPLDDFISDYCQDMKALVPENFFDATTVNGSIYAAPVYTDYTNDLYFVCKKEIFDETGFKEEDIQSYEDLTPLFEKVKELHPEMKILSSGAQAVTGSVGVTLNNEKYDALTDIAAVFYDKESEQTKVVNLFETDEYKKEAQIYRDWYNAGYIDQDILMRETDPSDDETVFGGFIQGNASRTQGKLSISGIELTSMKMAEGPVTTSSMAIMTMAIPVNATEPEAAARLMNLTYTNADLKNLVNYGIEGEDYTLEDGNVAVITENCTYAPNTNGLFGNVFNSYLSESEALSGVTRDASGQADLEYSPLLGFSVDTNPISNEVAQLSSVMEEYGKQVKCGIADEETYNEMIEKMYACGLENYLAEIQIQLDEWLAQE